jgi:GMP synthase (glutamine-hydrolysing)
VRVLAVVHQRDAGPGVFADAVREAGHELAEWVPREAGPPELEPYDAVLVFGGGMHTDQEDRHPWLREEKRALGRLLEAGTPLLGLCLGSQLVAEAAGAQPRRAREPEIGWLPLELTAEARRDPLLSPLPDRFEGFGWHSYEFPLPPGAVPLARSDRCLQGYRLEGPAWGLQFHAEVTREGIESWLRDYRNDEDAVRVGLDPDRVREQTAERIGSWNELGKGICSRFLARAES